MTGIKITDLPNSTLPYTGVETIPLTQDGETRNGTLNSFANYISAFAPPLTQSNIETAIEDKPGFLAEIGAVSGDGAGVTDAINFRTSVGTQQIANIVKDHGAVAGINVSNSIRTTNTVAIQSAINSGFAVYIPTGTYEINSAITWDLDQGIMFGDGSRLSVISQTAAGEHGIELTNSPEAGGVTKSGIIERLRITGVGSSSATGYGIYGYRASTPSMAFIRGRDLYITGFARGLSLERWDNSSFWGCEFNSNDVNVYAASQTRTLTFINCVNTGANNACWQTATGGNIAIYGCDTGNGGQHVLCAGNFVARDSNFETVTGTPAGHIEQTGGSMMLDNITMLGASSTLPAIFYTNAGFSSVGISGFGAGGGKIRKSSASSVGYFGGQAGLASNRQTGIIADNAGQFESLPPGTVDVVRLDSSSIGTTGNRFLIQFLAGLAGQVDRVTIFAKNAANNIVAEDILNRTTRATIDQSGATFTSVTNTSYKLTSANPQETTLPSLMNVDDEITYICTGAGGLTIKQLANQFVRRGSSVTITGTGGSVAIAQGGSVTIKCTTYSVGFQIVREVGTTTLV